VHVGTVLDSIEIAQDEATDREEPSMSAEPSPATLQALDELSHHAIIAGFGVPGRAFADAMEIKGVACVVIERNEAIVERCQNINAHLIAGDVRSEQVLRRAGIERASIIALTIPIEAVVLEAVIIARRLNPTARIIARVQYISAGLDAVKHGADEAVVAEELAAREFVRLVGGGRSTIRSNEDHR
jgi:voltage-gated potassium channel